jgi:hypothetical protein
MLHRRIAIVWFGVADPRNCSAGDACFSRTDAGTELLLID